MSILLQTMFFVLFLAIIYASYVHNGEWYGKIFAFFSDLADFFRKLFNGTLPPRGEKPADHGHDAHGAHHDIHGH